MSQQILVGIILVWRLGWLHLRKWLRTALSTLKHKAIADVYRDSELKVRNLCLRDIFLTPSPYSLLMWLHNFITNTLWLSLLLLLLLLLLFSAIIIIVLLALLLLQYYYTYYELAQLSLLSLILLLLLLLLLVLLLLVLVLLLLLLHKRWYEAYAIVACKLFCRRWIRWMYAYAYTYTYTYTYTRINLSLSIYIYIYTHTCTSIYIYIYAYIHTHTYIHTCINMFARSRSSGRLPPAVRCFAQPSCYLIIILQLMILSKVTMKSNKHKHYPISKRCAAAGVGSRLESPSANPRRPLNRPIARPVNMIRHGFSVDVTILRIRIEVPNAHIELLNKLYIYIYIYAHTYKYIHIYIYTHVYVD